MVNQTLPHMQFSPGAPLRGLTYLSGNFALHRELYNLPYRWEEAHFNLPGTVCKEFYHLLSHTTLGCAGSQGECSA
jgi:hypothetical protein